MSDSAKLQSAATAAASFNLMLLQISYSQQENPIAEDLKEGLITNGTQSEAWELIQELSDQNPTLSATPAKLAESNPEICIALGEIFASALVAAGGDNDTYYLDNAVEFNRKDQQISAALADLNAKTLSAFFRPKYN